jgi:hypothetical protein
MTTTLTENGKSVLATMSLTDTVAAVILMKTLRTVLPDYGTYRFMSIGQLSKLIVTAEREAESRVAELVKEN